MYRTLVVAVLFSVLAVPTEAGEVLEIGVKAGTNVTSPRGLADGVSSTSELSFLGGAFVQVGLGDLLAIGAELVYEGRNFSITTNLPDGSQQITATTSTTLNVPLFVRIGLPLAFSAELGVEYSHFLGGSSPISTDGQGLALLGLAWHPVSPLRVGVRFKPSFSSLNVGSIQDVGLNVTHLYVAWILL